MSVCSNLNSQRSIIIEDRYIQGVNYRLKHEDIAYIFSHADVDAIIVDAEFLPLLDKYRLVNPKIPAIVDEDTDASEGELSGHFDEAILEGLKYDADQGGKGWEGLEAQVRNEEDVIALAYTSGTTAKPKGVEFTHRGCYLAALGNVIESGLNYHKGRCRYLWTLPMFHAMGWTFPVSIFSTLINPSRNLKTSRRIPAVHTLQIGLIAHGSITQSNANHEIW